MSLSRRKALSIIGGGTILAAGGGAAVFATTRTPEEALRPWALAGGYDDPRRNALSYALLAPNPHNRQPWEVDLSIPDQVTIHRDRAKNLEFTDPFDRQLTIGMGCFVELMVIAAAEMGYGVDLDLLPEGEAGPVAVARFVEGRGAPDPLFAHVLDRRSCKEPFDPRPIDAATASRLAPHARIVTDDDLVARLRRITFDAWMVETSTPRTMKESVDLFRIGKAEIEASPDGIDLGGPFLETLSLAGVLTREKQMDPDSLAHREGIRMYETMLNATPNYAVLTTAGNDRLDQIEAGRRWVRLNLETTRLGLALHPVSQALQEFPEMEAHHREVHDALAEPGETVQMLGRLGHGPEVARTPRWPLEAKLRDS